MEVVVISFLFVVESVTVLLTFVVEVISFLFVVESVTMLFVVESVTLLLPLVVEVNSFLLQLKINKIKVFNFCVDKYYCVLTGQNHSSMW